MVVCADLLLRFVAEKMEEIVNIGNIETIILLFLCEFFLVQTICCYVFGLPENGGKGQEENKCMYDFCYFSMGSVLFSLEIFIFYGDHCIALHYIFQGSKMLVNSLLICCVSSVPSCTFLGETGILIQTFCSFVCWEKVGKKKKKGEI